MYRLFLNKMPDISNKTAVKPFCFDKRKSSQFFISNALWDTMEENWLLDNWHCYALQWKLNTSHNCCCCVMRLYNSSFGVSDFKFHRRSWKYWSFYHTECESLCVLNFTDFLSFQIPNKINLIMYILLFLNLDLHVYGIVKCSFTPVVTILTTGRFWTNFSLTNLDETLYCKLAWEHRLVLYLGLVR